MVTSVCLNIKLLSAIVVGSRTGRFGIASVPMRKLFLVSVRSTIRPCSRSGKTIRRFMRARDDWARRTSELVALILQRE
jgi:hypothetical protein